MSARAAAGVCDDDIAACYCPGDKYGRIPAPEGSPPGTPPVQRGRPMILEACMPMYGAHSLNPLRLLTACAVVSTPPRNLAPCNLPTFIGMLRICWREGPSPMWRGVAGEDGEPNQWGRVDNDLILGEEGWCNAERPMHRRAVFPQQTMPNHLGSAALDARSVPCRCSQKQGAFRRTITSPCNAGVHATWTA